MIPTLVPAGGRAAGRSGPGAASFLSAVCGAVRARGEADVEVDRQVELLGCGVDRVPVRIGEARAGRSSRTCWRTGCPCGPSPCSPGHLRRPTASWSQNGTMVIGIRRFGVGGRELGEEVVVGLRCTTSDSSGPSSHEERRLEADEVRVEHLGVDAVLVHALRGGRPAFHAPGSTSSSSAGHVRGVLLPPGVRRRSRPRPASAGHPPVVVAGLRVDPDLRAPRRPSWPAPARSTGRAAR